MKLESDFHENSFDKTKENVRRLDYFCILGLNKVLKQIKKHQLQVNLVGFNIWNNLAEVNEKILEKLEI